MHGRTDATAILRLIEDRCFAARPVIDQQIIVHQQRGGRVSAGGQLAAEMHPVAVDGAGTLLDDIAGDDVDATIRQIDAVAAIGGRPILDACVMLLGRERWFGVSAEQQLPALLEQSRRQQANVTTALSGQVFEALKLARQKSASEWAVGDKSDAEFAAGFENFNFGVA